MGAYSNLQNPENTYVLATSTNGWTLLDKLYKEPEEQLLQRWKRISENVQETLTAQSTKGDFSVIEQ